MNWHQSSLFTTAIVLLGTTGCKADDAPADSPPSAPPTGYAWKTAYYKRGFMGNYKTEWGDGVGSTLRVRVPMPFAGSAVRVRLQPGRDIPVGLSKMGYNSTPNMPVRYPDVLGQLLGLPTLNLGVNGDVIGQAYGGAGATIRSLSGVKSVILLTGINDIIAGRFTSAEDYAHITDHIVADLHTTGLKVYLGTILPAGGYAGYDKNPANEPLRTGINTWIKTKSAADGIIDFAAALADPAQPTKMQDGYQSDHLHPNDAGYHKMADTAAAILKAK